MPTTVDFDPEARRREARTSLGSENQSEIEAMRNLVIFPKCHGSRQRREPGLRRQRRPAMTAASTSTSMATSDDATTTNATTTGMSTASPPTTPLTAPRTEALSLQRCVTDGSIVQMKTEGEKKEGDKKYRHSLAAAGVGPGAFSCIPDAGDVLAVAARRRENHRGLRGGNIRSPRNSNHETLQDTSRHSNLSLESASFLSSSDSSMMPEERTALQSQSFSALPTTNSATREQLQSISLLALPQLQQIQAQSLLDRSDPPLVARPPSISQRTTTDPFRPVVTSTSTITRGPLLGRPIHTSEIPRPTGTPNFRHQRATTTTTTTTTNIPSSTTTNNYLPRTTYTQPTMDSSLTSRTADSTTDHSAADHHHHQQQQQQPKSSLSQGGMLSRFFKAGKKKKSSFGKDTKQQQQQLILDPLQDYQATDLLRRGIPK